MEKSIQYNVYTKCHIDVIFTIMIFDMAEKKKKKVLFKMRFSLLKMDN